MEEKNKQNNLPFKLQTPKPNLIANHINNAIKSLTDPQKLSESFQKIDQEQKFSKTSSLQETLHKLGFLKGDHDKVVDGKYGKNTENAKNRYLQSQLVKYGFLNSKQKSGRSAIDGIFGKASKAALQNAKAKGYVINDDGSITLPKQTPQKPQTSNKREFSFANAAEPYGMAAQALVEKGLNESSNANNSSSMSLGDRIKDTLWSRTLPGIILNTAQNYSPAAALVNGYIRGKLKIPTDYDFNNSEKKILSDQNQFIFDNWEQSINFGINSTNSLLAANQKKLIQLQKSNGDKSEIAKLQQEIENNKNSIQSLMDKRNMFKEAGGLEQYLKTHPGEKVVLGGNFRFYKDNNRSRFPQGTPTGYAKFKDPNFALYAESTPLGQVEGKFGNTQHSWVYDPETNQINTRASDSYDFNTVGTEGQGEVGDLRAAVGKSKALSTPVVQYSGDLTPIKENQSNYINSEDFGSTYTGIGSNILKMLGRNMIKTGVSYFK